MAPVVDPRDLYRKRRTAAEAAARERLSKELGEPGTAKDRQHFEREVDRLLDEWTAGWEGAGLPRGRFPLPGLGWLRRRRRA